MPKFYTILVVLSISFLIFTFKDSIKEATFNPKKLQAISNEKGLITTLQTIKSQHPLVTGLAAYVYQPLEESYYKSLIWTDISYIQDNKFFQAIPLNTQKYLNYRLVNHEYILMSYDNTEEKTYTDTYAADQVIVYNIMIKETIGEVIITFNVKPSPEEIEIIIRQLRTIKYFII